ncbi:hypothetical protein FMEXI_10280 [Fusarium mexicanum]|uniref:Uncharacterized protein n=1 Tax=Fusarium mexicanum TaxID=751941 RepID=A0A8H5MQN8_9HYPO|nr:hypothetical protein FMEXI_10280 [Fusarium mexicanum]
MMWKWAKNNPSVDVDHIFPLFPWTTEFAKGVLHGENRASAEDVLIKMRNNPDMERSYPDPATENWAKVKETYGGDPKNFYAKLRENKAAAQQH